MKNIEISKKKVFVCVFIIVTLHNLGAIGGISKRLLKRSRYCRKYPSDAMPPYRLHRETGRCYQIGETGPCHHLMKFTLENDDFGFCDCDLSQRCGRPLVYWPARQRCYRVYDQGPCRDGKWITFGYNLEPVCKKNVCEEMEQKQPSTTLRYWFNVNQTCYRTNSRGYCPGSDDILFNVNHHYRPTCQKTVDCGEVNPMQIAKCLPGQRLDVLGHCSRRFVALRNTTKPLQIHVTKKPANIYCLFCDNKLQNYKI